MDKYLRRKADDNNKPLNVERVDPVSFVKIENSKVVVLGEFKPFMLNPGESVILQFPEHHVGYINYKAISKGNIADSPTVLKVIAAEYIAELTTPQDKYDGVLSSGWLQREERASLFLPAAERLNRRFAFNLLKVERLDTGIFPIEITELYCDAVSASSMEDLINLNCDNQRLQDIYRFSAKTLLDCSQDVIEDAPKRDCRLWTGEFRISALCDTETFRNRNLVKRCLYLFGAHKIDDKIVAPCIFQYSPPYIDDDWYFIDFVLWFVAALNDYDEAYKYGIDTYLQNDANACAVAEWKFGAGKGLNNVIFLTFGTGLGAGLILNAKLYSGTNDNAGEIGHVKLTKNGPLGYFKEGTCEGYCSGSGIARLAKIISKDKRYIKSYKEFIDIVGVDSVSAKTIAEYARKGNAFCRRVFNVSGKMLGKTLSILIDVLNPQAIILGGVYMRANDLLNTPMEKELIKESLPFSLNVVKILPAGLGENIGDYAALSIAKGDF